MMAMPDLKPCPDCGGEAKLESDAPLCLILHWVSCSKCGCKTTKHSNREKVIKEWNERWKAMKTPDRTPEEIKKGLECCMIAVRCEICPYQEFGESIEECTRELAGNAFAYIQQLEASYQQVSIALCGKGIATLNEALQAASQVNPIVDGLNGGKMSKDTYIRCLQQQHEAAAAERDVRSNLAIEQSQRIGELETEKDQLLTQIKQLERERDAAVADLRSIKCCATCYRRKNCKPYNPFTHYCPDGWQWRGDSPEAEVQEDA